MSDGEDYDDIYDEYDYGSFGAALIADALERLARHPPVSHLRVWCVSGWVDVARANNSLDGACAAADGYDDDEAYDGAEAVVIPEKVKAFLLYFQRCLREGNMREIHSLYENTFNSLTETFFSKTAWPDVATVSELVGGDRVFLLFYREIYFRHIYANLQPTLAQRIESYAAYCELFRYLLGVRTIEDVPAGVLQLPAAWIWDIVDEFIYQFQSFCQYRQKLLSTTLDKDRAGAESELAQLTAQPGLWSIQTVLGILYDLKAKSNINLVLDRERADPDLVIQPSEAGFEFGAVMLYKMLGYFSLIGLLRLHVLLGDYRTALLTLEPIDVLDKKGYYTLVTACHISLFYFLGFAYMMMRRYVDAVSAWQTALIYITRTKQFHTRSYQYHAIDKMNEQMYVLLALTHSLCPGQRLDESLQSKLSKEHADRMQRMQRGELAAFQEAFTRACPKFITLWHAPAPQMLANQLALFMREVRQQLQVPKIRSYLKLYTSISVSKLASFFEMSPAELHTNLLFYKHKTRNVVWDDEDVSAVRGPIHGKLASMSDVGFDVQGSMVHIADTKVARRYGEFFMQNIRRFENIMLHSGAGAKHS